MKIKIIIISLILILISGCSSLGVSTSDDRSFYQLIALGEVENTTSVHKFGSGPLTTTSSIISQAQTYMTPLTPQSLEFVSSDAGDTFLGAGARQITIIGLNSTWHEQIITINTNGTTPVQIPSTWFRVYRWYVESSGTYSAVGTSPYLGNLNIQETGGGTLWTTIPIGPVPTSQSQIGAYTIPKGKTAYLVSKNIFVDTNRPADIYFFFRDNADDLTAPFDGSRRIIEREVGLAGGFDVNFPIPKGPFIGPCDMGFFGSVTQGTGVVSVEFELFLVDTE